MASSDNESLWNMMSKIDFLFEGNISDLTCVICKKVMADAVQSNVCGCQYCSKCIDRHRNDGDQYCPGKKQFCHDEPVKLNVNAFRKTMLNKRIAELKVHCPNLSCGSIVDLNEVINHLGSCEKQPIKCPFIVLGCDTERPNKDDLVTHLNSDTLFHTEILIDLIQNLRNEVKDLKMEFITFKEQSIEKDTRIIMLEEKLCQANNVILVQIEQNNNLKTQIENVRTAMDINIEDVLKCKLEVKNINEEIGDNEKRVMIIEEQVKNIRKDIEGMVEEETEVLKLKIDEQRRLIGDSTIEMENFVTMVNNLINQMNKIIETRKILDKDMERKMIYWIKYNRLCPKIDVDFVWRVTECSKKIDTDIYSESFYSHNYKLCLYMFLGSKSGNIYLYCYILKGSNDDRQQWPMRRSVTLSVMDQESLTAYKSETFEGALNKPTKEKGGRVGTSNFIQYSSIKDRTRIMVDDSLVLSCLLKDL